MKKSSILGVALASAGLAAVIGGECFATPEGWWPSQSATMSGNGVKTICLSTGTTYSGAPFVMNIKTVGSEDGMDFTVQLHFNNFVDQQCQTVNFPSGGYKYTIDLPAGAGDWAWNPSPDLSAVDFWVDMNMPAEKNLALGGDYSGKINAEKAILARGIDVNAALKRLVGNGDEDTSDEDHIIKNLAFVDTLPNTINPETSKKALISLGSVPVYAYYDGDSSVYIHSTASTIYANKKSFNLFANLRALETLTLTESFNTSSVIEMGDMFYGLENVSSLTLPNSFNTSKVTSMSGMFSEMSSLEALTLPATFNTSKVRDMNAMFEGMSNLQALSLPAAFNTSEVECMNYMFSGMSSIETLTLPATFNTSKVDTMTGMFEGMSSLEMLSLPEAFDTSEVEAMNYMFSGMSSIETLTLPNAFETRKVEDMGHMFESMTNLATLNLPSSFVTKNTKYMSHMFWHDESLSDISFVSVWDTQSAVGMEHMFEGDVALSDISYVSSWNTSNVESMSHMFAGTAITNTDALETKEDAGNGYAGWDVSNVTDLSGMFREAESLANIAALSSWNTSNVESMSHTFYDTAITSADALETTQYAGKSYTSWNVSGVKDMEWMFAASYLLTDISALASWDVSNVENMAGMFSGWMGDQDKWMSLTDISPLAAWNTSSVTDMNTMFRSNRALTDVSALARMQHPGKNYTSWDTSNVKNFNDMFMGVPNVVTFNPLESWDGHIADDASMYAMFYGIPFTTTRPSWYDGAGDGEGHFDEP